MAYAGQEWRNIDASNRWPFSYDFAQRMAADDAIVSVAWELDAAPSRSYPIVDPSPLARIVASSFDRTVATVWLDDMTEGSRYRLTAFVTTANGIEDDLWAHVSCDPRP
jgi:hypothetical protein